MRSKGAHQAQQELQGDQAVDETLWDPTVSTYALSVQQMLDAPYDPPQRRRRLDALNDYRLSPEE